MALTKQHSIILTALHDLSVQPKPECVSAREIYDNLSVDDKSFFPDTANDVSKLLTYFRDRKGYVANGDATYPNGRAVLSWRISKEGIDAIIGDKESAGDDDSSRFNLLDSALNIHLEMGALVESIKLMPAPKTYIVKDKELKIESITSFSRFLSDDIRELFSSIIKDLEAH